jgi:hypothetical protein
MESSLASGWRIECGGKLIVASHAYDEATGTALASDLQIDCANEYRLRHRWWQSDWQPVVDVVRKWVGAIE